MALALALDPPVTSVLPPGAGNKPKKAYKAEPKRAKKTEERYVDQTCVVDRDLDAPSVSRHHDCDVAPISTVEQAQCVLPDRRRPAMWLAV